MGQIGFLLDLIPGDIGTRRRCSGEHARTSLWGANFVLESSSTRTEEAASLASSSEGKNQRIRKYHRPGRCRSERWDLMRNRSRHTELVRFISTKSGGHCVSPAGPGRQISHVILLIRRRPDGRIHLRCRAAHFLCRRERTLVTHPLLCTDFGGGSRPHLGGCTLSRSGEACLHLPSFSEELSAWAGLERQRVTGHQGS